MYIWSCIVLLSWTIVILSVILFFFKQKTAYEMRISDWSSDVCSSDLSHASGCRPPDRSACCHDRRAGHPALPKHCRGSGGLSRLTHGRHRRHGLPWAQSYYGSFPRSEEHTSELQSLMRISYAVFCLQKKKSRHTATETIHETKYDNYEHS